VASWQTLGVEPPGPNPTRVQARRFVRDLQLRVLAMCLVAVVVVVLAGAPAWAIAVGLAVVVLGALDALYLTVSLRRAGG
jgi:hypothetical protein